ncbi:Asp23/Gls24 family envelope stress response protein [Myceligenerans xiligouense]|uniref:Cell envelope-related Asp23 family protein n=1 Tax=Myceligenerans xiligouense TaxID=253184 RepID=A0A3N4ZLT9_9MICO|nr:Asp23/Gls24 family envelope stress response protein [Myceligenerans xiligouense]RPF20891.1 cell envelope-related Asp23 family protein [Myceligenerans xiligouense]
MAMTPEDGTERPRGLELDPEDLDGHTLEELNDYLEAGRTPADPSIDGSPACRLALDSLERLRGLTSELIAADTTAEPEPDDSWVRKVLGGITTDAHAGRRIPLSTDEPHADLGITEGAVRGLVRAAENAFPGLFVGRCRLDGDIMVPGAPIVVRVEVSVLYGRPIPRLVQRLRAEIAGRLTTHTDLNVVAIDVTVQDVRQEHS